MKSKIPRVLLSLVLLGAIAVAALFALAWSGAYGIGADDPHARPVGAIIAMVQIGRAHV